MITELHEKWASTEVFFTEHAVFRLEEFEAFLSSRSGEPVLKSQARKSLLKYHQSRGRIVRIRRGLYASVPPGQTPNTYPIDTYLIAGRLTGDATMAYHTALAMHGVAHSIHEERLILTEKEPPRPFRFRGVRYRVLNPPRTRSTEAALSVEVETQDRQGLPVHVTTLERTAVDVLDRPGLSGGWEEVWRSLEGIDMYLDLQRMVNYAIHLNRASTAAKLGYFLQEHQERLHVSADTLDSLRRRSPKQPHYVERDRRSGARLVKEWNLMVPSAFFDGGGEAEDLPI